MDEEEDPVVKEIDVYLSKQLANKLYLLQYPVRPRRMTYDDVTHLSTKIKPKTQKLEMEVSLNTHSPNYDRSKGEQFAINVDGAMPGEKSFFSSGKMDKQVLASHPSGVSNARYVIGMYKEGELHVTPLHSMIHMRPSFGYLDKVDTRQKDQDGAGDSSQDEEEEAKAITVKFARRETAEGKARRLASYDHMRKKHDEEAWVQLNHHLIDDPSSEAERQYLFARQINEVSEFHTASEKYLEKLIPKMKLKEAEKPELPTNVLSMTDLKKMNLSDQVRALMINAKVIRTSQLLSLLPKGTDPTAMIRCLQQVALMVQGCWVVKSDILYPKDSASAHSGAPAEALCRARDYIMWKFTQSRFLVRKDISPVVKLVAEDVKDMFEQISRLKVNKGWEFLLECDTEFMNRHPDVVQRQMMIWEAKFKQLNTTLKLPASDIKQATQQASNIPLSPPKRRRTLSRSRTKSGGDRSVSESMSESDNEAKKGERSRRGSGTGRVARQSSGSGDRRRHSSGPATERNKRPSGTTAMDVTENHVANGASAAHLSAMDTTENAGSLEEIKKELTPFIKEKLCRHFVIKLSELKAMFHIYLTQLKPGHVLGRGVTEKTLEDTVYEVGGVKMMNTQIKQDETFFAMPKLGDQYDPVRVLLVDYMQKHLRFQTKPIRKLIEDNDIKLDLDDNMIKKIIREFCDYKAGYFYLKGSLPS